MRFYIVVLIAVLIAAFGAGSLGLKPIPAAVIVLAAAFVAALVEKVILPFWHDLNYDLDDVENP